MANRRTFLKAGALGAAGTLPLAWDAIAQQAAGSRQNAPVTADRTVKLTGDGLALSPSEYARLVVRLVEEKNLVPTRTRSAASSKISKTCSRGR
jgi:hypothetical protein